MASAAPARKSRNMTPIVLTVIGIIVFVVGVALAAIPAIRITGSGNGTVLILVGIVLLLVGGWRYTKRSKPSQ